MLLLRAIVAAPSPPPRHDLVVVRAGGLVAVASAVDRVPRADEEALRAHHALVEEIHARQACLPARFGRVFGDAAALADALAARAAELRAELEAVAGRAELAVTLAWRSAPGATRPRGGTAYLAAAAERERERRRARLVVASLVEELDLDRPSVRHRTCPAGGIAAAVAILTGRDEVNDIRRGIARFAERSDVVTAAVYGPMAPYSFVS